MSSAAPIGIRRGGRPLRTVARGHPERSDDRKQATGGHHEKGRRPGGRNETASEKQRNDDAADVRGRDAKRVGDNGEGELHQAERGQSDCTTDRRGEKPPPGQQPCAFARLRRAGSKSVSAERATAAVSAGPCS